MIGDHPRLRGEHFSRTSTSTGTWGSSPLARGAPASEPRGEQPARIIPACAGSTLGLVAPSECCQDHPRLRGEHSKDNRWLLTTWGSSPLARGARGGVELFGHIAGIIPACAGSTRTPCEASLPARDHPRLRGEHAVAHHPRVPDPGSSPLARGALRATVRWCTLRRIIPACAGSTGRAR